MTAKTKPPTKRHKLPKQRAEQKKTKRGEEADGCMVCGATPTVEDTGLCGPCCFGDASTAGGNW